MEPQIIHRLRESDSCDHCSKPMKPREQFFVHEGYRLCSRCGSNIYVLKLLTAYKNQPPELDFDNTIIYGVRNDSRNS